MKPLENNANERGIALVITLSIIVLITFLLVAFFSSATTNRLVENTSAGGAVAKLLASSASDAIISDLKVEIITGSSDPAGPAKIYYPKTAADMVPQRALPTTILPADANFANLIKQSGVRFSQSASVFNFSSSDDSATPDANRRKVSATRWSAPMLTGAQFLEAAGTSQVPKWIYITPTGYTASISKDVIGRIAFNVYDVGGLLNANASGFAPGAGGANDVSGDFARKGSTVWADLRALTPDINANAFGVSDAWPPKWRVTGDWSGFSLRNPDNYYYERTGWRAPFLDSGGAASDRMFASRQDLIRYAKAYPETFAAAGGLIPALRYMTHWSRWNNAPSFKHDETRPFTKAVIGGVAVGGNDYTDPARRADANPFIPAVPVVNSFRRKRIDGSGSLIDRPGVAGLAAPGESLVKFRFPLRRLGLVTRRAASVDTSTAIYSAFGLTKAGGIASPWIYSAINPTNERIYTLAEIAALGREPNFFELLKASIHAGSLGKASGAGAISSRDAIDGNLDIQIWRLGVNLIDQYDGDSYPTIIRLPPGTSYDDGDYLGTGTIKVKIYGIENLPQVQGVMQAWKFTGGRNASSTPQGGTIIMKPVLWNPHDTMTYADPGSGGPTTFRVWGAAIDLQYLKEALSTTNPNRNNSWVQFNGNDPVFREPNLIARPNRDGINATPNNVPPLLASIADNYGVEWLGGGRTEPAGGICTPGAAPYFAANSANGMSIYVDYLDTDGSWVTYSALESVTHNGFIDEYHGYMSYFAKPDPRSQRFGSFGSQTGNVGQQVNGTGVWNYAGSPPFSPPPSGQMASLWDAAPRGPVVGVGGWTGQFAPGRGAAGNDTNPTATTLNTEAAAYRYTDPDGILRWGDSGFGANGMISGQTNTGTRPIILNRPFQSVGEMGYAFRDMPWKSLDFFSERSGDSALLDVFCIAETPDDGIVANRVSLNAAPDKVLESILKGGLRRDAGGTAKPAAGDALSNAEVATVITTMRNVRNTAPYFNKNELVTRVMGTFPSSGNFAIKRQRESLVRAVADMVETRNWNVMIDVIAQSGRPAGGGANFVAEGESRLWQFTSIDRSRASVLDHVSEAVAE